ncbi:heme lyase CcmF/NrfE family subunit [Trabulsiella odontotermitis]|uniref:heme lyase CcmF/NrfE family subunit n=1 Tax=Trabulsiella odontotermitis TaxID=379893 RepID=UPI00092CE7A7|nr:heme lyase CcmF/NrfE family subunit [Trabulsiella odontotermitis]
MELFVPEAGFLALLLSLGASLLTPLATLTGVRLRWRSITRLAVGGVWIQFIFLLLAFAILIQSFISDNFTVVYVAQHSHRSLPLGLKIAAVWGGHEGSLLLWIFFLSGWSALFAWRYRQQTDPLFAWTLTLLSALTALLLLFVVIWSDPFVRLFPPAVEGRDLNPMLQHIGLILHPPLLYLGYGGLIVAAAVALASLLRGGFSAAVAWVCWRWALPGWCALTLGILLGSWWAYCELGWGGWWFWDPVENASLMPWLSASALLHSLFASRQRGIYRHWSLLLAILTMILSLLGTLIVRSGILVSVHAFALDNVRAVPLFALFAVLSLGSLLLYGWRARIERPAARYAAWSRETFILASLLLFAAVLLIVLIGTLYPMIYGLVGGGRLSVGAPYFNLATLPFGLLMLITLGLAAGGFWKRSPHGSKRRTISILVIALAAVALTWSFSVQVALPCGLVAGVMTALWGQPLTMLKRQLPALLAHTGVLLVAAGIIFSSGSRQEISVNLAQGQSVTLADYTFRFERLEQLAKDNYTTEKAFIDIYRNDARFATLTPERRYYPARRQQMVEPAIDWDLLRDRYVVIGEKTGENRFAMRFYVQTGIRWIWGGGLLMIAGALLSGWRGRRCHD